MQNPGGLFSRLQERWNRRHGDLEKGHYEILDSPLGPDSAAPRSDRDPTDEQSVSELKSTFNVMNYLTGGGFIAIPYSVKIGGLSALVCLIILPCALWYTAKILIDCLYTKCETSGVKIRVRATYREVAEACLPGVGGILSDVFIYSHLLTGVVSYIVLSSSLLLLSFPSVPLTQTSWKLAVAAVVLSTLFIEKLGRIAWLSVAGLVAVLGVVVAVVAYAISCCISTQTIARQSSALLAWNTEHVAVAVGISFFCYETHNMITDMEEHMAQREKFGRALCTAYSIVTSVKVIYALVSFWAFGAATQQVIIHNLPTGAVHMTVTLLYVGSMLSTCALPVHAIIHNLEHSKLGKYLMSVLPDLVWFVGVRVVIFAAAVLIAVAMPHYASAVAFLGSFQAPLGILVYPCAMHVMLKRKELSLGQMIFDVFLAIVGLFTWVVMLYFTSKNLFADQ